MFDSFESFQSLKKQNFVFSTTRYEVWADGKIVEQSDCLTQFRATVVIRNGVERIEISVQNSPFAGELAQKFEFDEFLTGHDRLQLVTIPQQSNIDNMGMMMLKMTVGPTRNEKIFAANEPFCFNLFLQHSKIVKVSLTLSNPEKLIEFYDDRLIQYDSEEKSKSLLGVLDTDFFRLRRKVILLPLNQKYRCEVYRINGEKLINNEKGFIKVETDKIFLNTSDDSGDYLIFFDKDRRLYCNYVVMNGQTIVDEELGKIELISVQSSTNRLDFSIEPTKQ